MHTVTIQDILVISQTVYRGGFPKLRLLAAPTRDKMLKLIYETICILIKDAEASYNKGRQSSDSEALIANYITRLSTNEFFFYTDKPLTLSEFENLINKVAVKAKETAKGVQLILGSFAVLTNSGRVMNVTPFITCGSLFDCKLVIKSYTSYNDYSYSKPDFDARCNTSIMPKINILGDDKQFSFNNLFISDTPGGNKFIVAIEVCLDHFFSLAKKNYFLMRNNTKIEDLPLSQVVVACSFPLILTNCIAVNPLIVDPLFTKKGAKRGFNQQTRPAPKLPLAERKVTIYDIEEEQVGSLQNTYAYKTANSSGGRKHRYNVSSENMPAKNRFNHTLLQQKDSSLKGDHFKTQILKKLKLIIENTTNWSDFLHLKRKLASSYEVYILKQQQDLFSRSFGMKTSSIKALEKMLKQQEEHLVIINSKKMKC